MASRGVNKVILIGNLGADPEVRFMPSGGAVANVSIATSESWKDKNTGQPVERTEWHRVVFYNRLAEIVRDYLRKGASVYVEGGLRTREWEKDGVKHYTTEIVAQEMRMLGGKGEAGGGPGAGHPPAVAHPSAGVAGGGRGWVGREPSQGAGAYAPADYDDGDLPF